MTYPFPINPYPYDEERPDPDDLDDEWDDEE